MTPDKDLVAESFPGNDPINETEARTDIENVRESAPLLALCGHCCSLKG
jgi:hypothetical protein